MAFELGVSKAGFRITMSHLRQNLFQTSQKNSTILLKGHGIAIAKFQEIP